MSQWMLYIEMAENLLMSSLVMNTYENQKIYLTPHPILGNTIYIKMIDAIYLAKNVL
jgi:hypothetical protein